MTLLHLSAKGKEQLIHVAERYVDIVQAIQKRSQSGCKKIENIITRNADNCTGANITEIMELYRRETRREKNREAHVHR